MRWRFVAPSKQPVSNSLKKTGAAQEYVCANVKNQNRDLNANGNLVPTTNHMTRLFAPFVQKLGVTYPQYLVLVVLWERGPQGVGDLASLLRMDFGTLSPMLKRLESKGLVSRRRQATDERRVLVDLTPKGVTLRKRTEQMLGEFYCFLNLTVEELFDLKDRLRHFVNSAGPKEARATLITLPARAA
jgi:MarR family transcriptional regulator, organic hydroperoxide resistance regulator